MSPESSSPHETTLRIAGMHCASCELMVERKLKKVAGVQSVDADFATGKAVVTTDPANPPDNAAIADAVREAGYSLDAAGLDTLWRDVAASIVIVVAGYLLLQRFDMSALTPSTSDIASLGAVLVVGLIAGTSSCLAVTGGLLLALSATHNERHGTETTWRKFVPMLHFNVGRLASYFVLGGVVGLVGQSITLTPRMTGYANIAVALLMAYFALHLLHVLPKNIIRLPKSLTRRIADLSESDHPAAPAILGALTFFLPCGFTQSMQLVALASGNPASGAAVMFVFALGTMPFLLGIGALGASLKGAFARSFLHFSAVLVLALAVFNLQTGMALAGIDVFSGFRDASRNEAAVPRGGVQEVSMAVTAYGYEPNAITIAAGVPVRWLVDGTGASGCTSVLTIPDLNVSQVLNRGVNVIEFTAPTKGTLAFMCSMGMVRGSFTVL